ncbi:hypothetical protein SCWH03_02300 [Streptomyces pacificus]|uniref:Uncharacterized protein n=1 Tax=Streptomyces pacificus TaxID=2705029 RepID=A0A6A0ANI8_9ACTN|nr:hypothetical protein SCWH03_02300 [Streptomyces pacificus]
MQAAPGHGPHSNKESADVRTLLALLLSWLMPSTGRRRAQTAPRGTHAPPNRGTADAPARRLFITRRPLGVERPAHWPPLTALRAQILRGEDGALIRPYLIAWEQEQEQERRGRRDRRRATVPAALGRDFASGVDFHGATA